MFLILLLTILLVIYIYIKRKYFTLYGPVPGLSPHVYFGNLIQTGILFKGATTTEVFPLLKRRFGDIFQFWLGPTRIIVVSNIADVQHIFTNRNTYELGDVYVDKLGAIFPDSLIGIKGATLKRHATYIRPIFRRAKIIVFQNIIIDSVDKLLDKWRSCPTEKVHLDTVQQCQNLLLNIFGFIAYDCDFEALDDDVVTNNNELLQAVRVILDVVETVLQLPNIIASMYLKLNSRYVKAVKTIEQYCNQIIDRELAESPESIAQRKKSSFITSLAASLQQDEKAEMMKSEEERTGLSRNEVLQELIVFIAAGSDTSATFMSWFIHLMSKHPRVQKKLKEELMDAYDNKHPLSLDHLESLVYLDAVIKEIFRMSPPFDGTFRTLIADDCLPETGAQLYKGDQVYISFPCLGKDPRYWSIDPELFYPERFLEKDKDHHPYALIPFGAGHRQCMGQDLARFQLKLIISRLMQYVTFGDGGPQVNGGGYKARFSVIPKRVGVTITFD